MDTDPELAAAVARAMGRRLGREGPNGECMVYEPSKTALEGLQDALTHDALATVSSWKDCRPYTPDIPGNDFCEALAWASKRLPGHGAYFRDEGHCIACCVGDFWSDGDTIEQSLCRAIVALGETAAAGTRTP